MNAAVKVLNYPHAGTIRIVKKPDDNSPWWVLRDVLAVTQQEIQRARRILTPENRDMAMVPTTAGEQFMIVVSSAGLWQLLDRGARTPSASSAFLEWADSRIAEFYCENWDEGELEPGPDGSPSAPGQQDPLRFAVHTISNLVSEDVKTRLAAKDDALKLINLIAKLLEEKAAA